VLAVLLVAQGGYLILFQSFGVIGGAADSRIIMPTRVLFASDFAREVISPRATKGVFISDVSKDDLTLFFARRFERQDAYPSGGFTGPQDRISRTLFVSDFWRDDWQHSWGSELGGNAFGYAVTSASVAQRNNDLPFLIGRFDRDWEAWKYGSALKIEQSSLRSLRTSFSGEPQQNGRPEKQTIEQNEQPVGELVWRFFRSLYGAAILGIGRGLIISWWAAR